MIWTTVNGTQIAIKDMSTHHILNCIARINRNNGKWRPEYLEIFKRELDGRNIKISR